MKDGGARTQELMLKISKLADDDCTLSELFTASACVMLACAQQMGMSWQLMGDRLSMLWVQAHERDET